MLRDYTTLRIGGPAASILEVSNPGDIDWAMKGYIGRDMQFLTIGKGSNCLFSDRGYNGCIILTKGLNEIKEITGRDEETVEYELGSGVLLQRVITLCMKHGYTGMEGLAGIPGTVGGALFGNAGSFGVEFGNLVKSAVIYNKDTGLKTLTREELGLEYRHSIISNTETILSVRIGLRQGNREEVNEKIKRYLSQKKASQPVDRHSAGCVFKNPIRDSAGRLIDAAGCKGMSSGGIEVSRLHANFFINSSNGTCSDFLGLMDRVRERVFKEFNVTLEPEIRIYERYS